MIVLNTLNSKTAINECYVVKTQNSLYEIVISSYEMFLKRIPFDSTNTLRKDSNKIKILFPFFISVGSSAKFTLEPLSSLAKSITRITTQVTKIQRKEI